MHNRLWIAAILAVTPILALSPVAFPSTHDAGCVKPIPGERWNQRVLRVGNRHLVMDPAYLVDEYHRAVTFDSTFTKALALVAEL